MFAGALLLLLAAAPDHPLLTIDSSVFADVACLAPGGDGCSVAAPAPGDGAPRLTASAALYEADVPPGSRPKPLLELETGGLLAFGPELASRMACVPKVRHRPDRSVCAFPARRRAR